MSYFPEIAKNGLRFIIAKISNSKREIEIRLASNDITQNEEFNFNLSNLNISRTEFYKELNVVLKNNINSNSSDIIIPTGDGKYIPLVNCNYFEDNFLPEDDINKTLFVLKLNKPLPTTFKKLDDVKLLVVKSEIVSNEILYGGELEVKPQQFGESLDVDYSINPVDISIKETSTYQSQNEITSSIPRLRLQSIASGSNKYKKRLIDYSDFKNFVHFSSAEKRINNFKTKLETIETHLNNISQSLYAFGQNKSIINNHAKETRQQNFESINNIVNDFTDYENWLYYDCQQTSTKSVPGIGKEYTDSSASLNISPNVVQKFNTEGFNIAYVLSGSSTETIEIVKDKYNLNDINFNNTTSSIYLSFLMRASSSVSDNLVHSNTLTSSIPFYPMDSLNLETISNPTSTGSAYKRYIFKSSGSHWILNNTNQTVGVNTIDFGRNSSDIILTSGSGIFAEQVHGVGEYANYITYNTGSGASVSGSFVPKGDLFNLSINPTDDTDLSGIITDVKVTSKNPENILPFHQLESTDSSNFTSWYNDMITSASFYDSQNIQRLTNNIPSTYINDESTNRELLQYVDSIGEFFDEYKIYVDDYYRLFNQGYSDYKEVPSRYNKLLAENLGFNILPIKENNFLKLFGLNDNLSTSQTYSDSVINNFLNNLSYLYKTKGTRNSINALLNCYGLPSNVLKIKEGHTHLKNYDQGILSNDAEVPPFNIFNQTSSIVNSYVVNTDNFKTIIINDDFDSDNFNFVWNTDSTITQSSVEAVFKMPQTTNTMSLFSNYASNDSSLLWQVNMIPSGSSVKGKFEFRISTQTNGSSDLVANSVKAETDFLHVLDNSLINVLVQKSSSNLDISDVHTYELVIGKTTPIGGEFSFLTSSKLEVDGDSNSTSNKNFISGSEGRHLFIGNDYTGSLSQIKSYSSSLSLTAFKQHVYNKKSIVGNEFNSPTSNLQFYYPLQEDYVSGSTTSLDIKDASVLNKGGDFALDSNMFVSMSIIYDTTIIENTSFPIFGDGSGNANHSDNLISIEDTQLMTSNLNPDSSVLRYNQQLDDPDFVHSRDLYFSRSPQEIINDFLVDNLGNLDFNDLFADPRDEFKTTYPDLDNFNDELKSYDIAVDLTRFIEATKKIFNNSFLDSVRKLLPIKAKVNVGNTIKPTYTSRTKIPPLLERPSTQLQVQPESTNSDAEAGKPTLESELFTPPEDNLHGFQTSTSSLGAFEETDFGFTGDDNEYSLNDKFFEPDINQFPQKFWGSSSSDAHFKSPYQAGFYNDYNTYHYESRAVFTGLTDPERIIHTTSSFSGINNTNYTASKTFTNRKILKTNEFMPNRFLGVTQQLFSTSSKEEPYGKVIDSDTRVPIRHINNLSKPPHYTKGYEGTKLGNFEGTSQHYPGKNLWNAGYVSNPFNIATGVSNQEWTDTATASFYRKQLGVQNQNQLRIVKDSPNQENNVN